MKAEIFPTDKKGKRIKLETSQYWAAIVSYSLQDDIEVKVNWKEENLRKKDNAV